MEHGDPGSETRQIENHFITPTTNLEHIWWWQKLPWWSYRSLPACPCESCGCVWHVLCLVSRSICQNIFNIDLNIIPTENIIIIHVWLILWTQRARLSGWRDSTEDFRQLSLIYTFLLGLCLPPITAQLWSSDFQPVRDGWTRVLTTWHWGCCLRPRDSWMIWW